MPTVSGFLASSSMRVRATTYSFQAAMKVKITAVTTPGIVSGSCLVLRWDGGEEAVQEPDREGEVERGVGQDDRQVGVDQVEVEELAVEADDQGCRGEHLGDQDQEQERDAAGEAEPGGEVGRRDRGQHHDDGRGGRDQQRGLEPVQESLVAENLTEGRPLPGARQECRRGLDLSLIHISEPTRLGMISY